MVVKYMAPPSWLIQQYFPSPPWINTWPQGFDDSWSHDGSRLPRARECGFNAYSGLGDLARSTWDAAGIWQGSGYTYDQTSDPEDAEFDDWERIPWIPSLHLTMRDKLEIIHGKMLSDKHIYAALVLLRIQFPGVGSLQDPCLCQTSFRPAEGDTIVQIHHTRGNHWVVSSSEDGAVRVYDSIYQTVSDDLTRQLKQIYGSEETRDPEGSWYVVPPTQKQTGSKDCALFAIAFAYEICSDNDPQEKTFEQSKMRNHLIKCFETAHIAAFPS